MAKPKIDWNRAKREFLLTKEASLQDIATKYGISYGRVRKMSMNEGWVAKKRQVWRQADKAAIEEIRRTVVETARRDARRWDSTTPNRVDMEQKRNS